MIEVMLLQDVIGVWISHTCLDPHITGVSSVWLYEKVDMTLLMLSSYIKLASSI